MRDHQVHLFPFHLSLKKNKLRTNGMNQLFISIPLHSHFLGASRKARERVGTRDY
jgi:hypothetical protein